MRILGGFLLLTLPLMPLQAGLLRLGSPWARKLPHWYHRQVCRLFGLRIHLSGSIAAGEPVLIIANHASWLDIFALSAVAPLSFIAKKEVGGWPLAGTLARLQRTIFVDRERRSSVADTRSEIIERLQQGDTIVLFAEGTSSDGNRVLPFKTPLFAAVTPTRGDEPSSASHAANASVQTLALAYTKMHGIPLGRAGRPLAAWYGDMALAGHVWDMLSAGPLDIAIEIGPPVPLEQFADRKVLARYSEQRIRAGVSQLLRRNGKQAGEPLARPAVEFSKVEAISTVA